MSSPPFREARSYQRTLQIRLIRWNAFHLRRKATETILMLILDHHKYTKVTNQNTERTVINMSLVFRKETIKGSMRSRATASSQVMETTST